MCTAAVTKWPTLSETRSAMPLATPLPMERSSAMPLRPETPSETPLLLEMSLATARCSDPAALPKCLCRRHTPK